MRITLYLLLLTFFTFSIGAEDTIGPCQGLPKPFQLFSNFLATPSGGQSEFRPGHFTFSLGLANDNKLFGIYDMKAPTHLAGDDLGYTHGYLVSMKTDLQGRLQLTLLFSNDLFTRAMTEAIWRDKNGTMWVPQHFKEETKALAMLDNKKQDRLLFWRLGGGLHVISGKPSDSPLSTSKQQNLLHHAVNEHTPINFRERVQLDSGESDRIGAILSAELGLQKNIINLADGKVQLTIYSSAGMELSTLTNASSVNAKLGNDLSLKMPALPLVGQLQAHLKTELSAEAHAYGAMFKPQANLSLGNQYLRTGAEYTAYYGKLPNHVEYNVPGLNRPKGENDDILTLFVEFTL